MSPKQFDELQHALSVIRPGQIDQIHFLRHSTHEYLTVAYESADGSMLHRTVIDRDGNKVDRLSKSSQLRRRT